MRRIGLMVTLSCYAGVSTANEAHSIISQMPEGKRNSTFATFMQRSGEACGTVTRTFFQGFDSKWSAFWSVQCSNEKAFNVMIYDDSSGSTRILDCKVLKAVAKMDCFKKF
jgi:hypothetical protein